MLIIGVEQVFDIVFAKLFNWWEGGDAIKERSQQFLFEERVDLEAAVQQYKIAAAEDNTPGAGMAEPESESRKRSHGLFGALVLDMIFAKIRILDRIGDLMTSIILHLSMASRHASPPIARGGIGDRHLPLAKGQARLADQFRPVAGMGLMAGLTGTAFPLDGCMDVVEV